MAAHMQNPGGQAGASRNQLDGCLLFFTTTSGRQEQTPDSPFLRHLTAQRCPEAAAMTEKPFPTHRQAALALLINNYENLNASAARFLGQISADPSPLSVKQAHWLAVLLNRAGLPPLNADGV